MRALNRPGRARTVNSRIHETTHVLRQRKEAKRGVCLPAGFFHLTKHHDRVCPLPGPETAEKGG
jgi:hypothetical protein